MRRTLLCCILPTNGNEVAGFVIFHIHTQIHCIFFLNKATETNVRIIILIGAVKGKYSKQFVQIPQHTRKTTKKRKLFVHPIKIYNCCLCRDNLVLLIVVILEAQKITSACYMRYACSMYW